MNRRTLDNKAVRRRAHDLIVLLLEQHRDLYLAEFNDAPTAADAKAIERAVIAIRDSHARRANR